MDSRGLFSSTRGRSELVDFIIKKDWIKKNVLENHSHDSTAEGNFHPDDLLEIVNNVLIGTNGLIDKDGDSKQAPKDASGTIFPSNISPTPKDALGTIIPSEIFRKINWICCQMTCEAGRHKNQEHRLREFFQELSSYRWFTQVLVVLAAFAVHYGSFWYLSEAPCDGNALLKGLSSLKRNLISDKHKKAINKVVKDLLDLTTELSRLVHVVNENRGKHTSELAEAYLKIPLWSCQSIIAILAAGNYFARLIDADKFAESELGDLELIVSTKKNEVSTERKACEKALASWEKYRRIVIKFEAPVDIVDFLKTFLAGEDSAQDPILIGPNKTPVKLESFRKKSVLLIITAGFKISKRDVAIFQSVHVDPKLSQEIKLVWIPFVDGMPENLEAQPKFESLMPWAFKVSRELNKYVRKYIHDEWHFQGGTMAVELDFQGLPKDKNYPDVMPMLRIWGPRALYPDIPIPTHHWVEDVIKPLVPRQKLDAVKTEYILFYGGAAATKLESNVTHESLSAFHIEDTEHFLELLRCYLLCRLKELKTNPLSDPIVCEISEAYKARQMGGFKILTKRPGLQIQHIGTYHAFSTLVSDLKWAIEEVTKNAVTNIAEAFRKKELGVQQPSDCKHLYVPFYPGLKLWGCPDGSQSVGYDLDIMCCRTRPDDAEAHRAGSSANATTTK